MEGLEQLTNVKKSSATPIILAITIAFIIIFISVGTSWGIAMAFKNRYTGETPNYSGIGGGGELTCPPNLNADMAGNCIDNTLKKILPSSPLIGFGKDFVAAGMQYNINPAFLVAIGGNESSFGTNYKSNANGKANHNYQNMKCDAAQRFSPEVLCDGDWAKWASWSDSIRDHAKYMRMNYLDKNLMTIDDIRRVYCPERGCESWTSTVTTYFSRFTGDCPSLKSPSNLLNIEGGVMIDPGHRSGHNSFSSSISGANNEGDHNWNVAVKVKEKLEARGIKTGLTKSSAAEDLPLPDRAQLANNAKAAILVSIHSDASNGRGSGPTAIISCQHQNVVDGDGSPNYISDFQDCPPSANSRAAYQISLDIAKSLSASFGFGGRAKFLGGQLGVLDSAEMPAFIIEMFFHDNNDDLRKIDGKDDELATIIADGLAQALGK